MRMKNILCYGDSNTFGYTPAGGRYDLAARWTGRLAAMLGPEYHIIEEGMCGRNTVWDDAIEPMRNGLRFLPVALQSHQPLDMVIVSLGTNDCKVHLNAPAGVIALGLTRIVECIKRYPYDIGSAPEVLIVSPIFIGDGHVERLHVSYDHSSAQKTRQLAPLFEQVAGAHGCLFLDAAKVAGPSAADQLHMEPEGHAALANALYPLVRGCFSD